MVPDVVTLDIPLGGRMLAAGELLLRRASSPSSDVAAAELAAAISAWEGPGAVVLVGDTFDLLGDTTTSVAAALAAHPQLAAALKAFACGAGRRVVCLPGAHDRRLAWDERAQQELADGAGATVALAVDAAVTTGRGARRVRLEAGTRLDPRFAPVDPHSPADTPLGVHVVTEVLPDLPEPWAGGADRLADLAALPRFLASRLLYRRLGRWAWLLLLPFAAALAIKVPLSFALAGRLDRALGPWTRRLALLVAATVIDLAVIVTAVAAVLTRGWSAVVGRDDAAPLDAAVDDDARRLIADGYTGLVVGHTRRTRLHDLGGGFVAAVGAAGEVTAERRGRLGLPNVFVPERVVAWLEIEAGAELHVRAFHGRVDVPGASLLERAVGAPGDGTRQPTLVASFPGGESWPPIASPLRRATSVRRRAAGLIAAAGVLDLGSAVTPPFESRLRAVRDVVPLAVPQAATALVALAGLGLLALARGVRRGQRDAWRLAVALLAGSVVLHVVKGEDVEEAVVAALVVVYLVAHRGAFGTARSRAGIVPAVVTIAGVLAAVTVGAAAVIEVVTAAHHARLPLADALLASAERLVAVDNVTLPPRVDQFVSPTLLAVALGSAAWLALVLVRPAAARRSSRDEATRARTIVDRWGAGTLDYFALRADKDYFFHGDTVVAYAVHHGVGLVSPDPIGPRWERDTAWAAFRAFADRQGWAVAVLGASEDWLPLYRASGMHDLYVGDEAVVDVGRFTLDGGRHKGLRQAVNRVAKYGYTMTFHDPATIDAVLQASLRDVMGGSRRGDVERGFSMTLGRIFEPDDRGLLLAVCHAPDGHPVAFCQYVPAPGIDGYSLDLMRRDAGEHPNGLLDFVVVETIRRLHDDGRRRLGLNFATMRAVLAGETGAGLPSRVERWALQRMSGSMQIESLWHFNAKFDPDWHARYVAYDSPEHLVAIAFAIARAESFWELPVVGRFLVPTTPERAAVTTPAPDGGSRSPRGA